MPAIVEALRRSFVEEMWEADYLPRPRLNPEESKERIALRKQIVGKMNDLLDAYGRPVFTRREGCTMTAIDWTPVQIDEFSCELWLWRNVESIEGIPYKGLEYDLLVQLRKGSGSQTLLHLERQLSIQPVSWSVTGQFGRRAELAEYRHTLVALDSFEKAKFSPASEA